jgi:hypothetical protein
MIVPVDNGLRGGVTDKVSDQSMGLFAVSEAREFERLLALEAGCEYDELVCNDRLSSPVDIRVPNLVR